MKNIFKNLIFQIFAVLFSVMVVTVVVKAASGGLLTPPSNAFSGGVPVGTMKTIADINNLLPLKWQADPGLSLCWSSGDAFTVANCSAASFLKPNGTGTTPSFGALEYCQYLKQDATGLNCTGNSPNITCAPVNYWRLPTEAELMNQMENEYLPGGRQYIGLVNRSQGFQLTSIGQYWSSSASGNNVWIASNIHSDWFASQPSVGSYLYSKSSAEYVRCVH